MLRKRTTTAAEILGAGRQVIGPFGRTLNKLRVGENSYMLGLALVIGLLGGYGAIAVSELIELVTGFVTGANDEFGLIEVVKEFPTWKLFLLPTLGGLLVGPLTYFLAREAKGHGVPEVIESVAIHSGKMRPRVALVKAITSALTIGTGGSVGREGPMVQIGASLGSTIAQLVRAPQETVRTLVAAGASAGIAAAFNAPVAGVFFSIEVIIGRYAINTLSPLVLSSVVATVVSRHYLGSNPTLTVPAYEMVSPYEIPFYILLGLACGVMAVLLIVSISRSEDFFDRLPGPEWIKPAIGGFALGGLFLVSPYLYGMGFEATELLLTGKMAIGAAFLLVLTKILATSITLGSGGSGGVFSPALVLGAGVGGLCGMFFHMIAPETTAPIGAYAMVGMAASVAATIHAPITAIVMIFEMTGDYSMILPLMLGCIISSQFSQFLKPESIYTEKLRRRGINLERGLDLSVMETTLVDAVMRTEIDSVPLNADFRMVLDKLLNGPAEGHYVLDENEQLIGLLTIEDIKGVINEPSLQGLANASDLMRSSPPFVTPDQSLAEAMREFSRRHNLEELPVVDNKTERKLVGKITRRDIFVFYDQEIIRRGTLAKALVQLDSSGAKEIIKLPAGGGAAEFKVNAQLVGKSLRELDLRAKFKVNIVAIRREGRNFDDHSETTDPGKPLQKDDILLMIGAEENIKRFSEHYDLHLG